jgi:hypothetical protein
MVTGERVVQFDLSNDVFILSAEEELFLSESQFIKTSHTFLAATAERQALHLLLFA